MKGTVKLFVFALFSAVLLSACGTPNETPETVIDNAKEALIEIKSGDVDFSIDLMGSSEEDDIQFNGDIVLLFDHQDEKNKKVDLHVDISGDMQAQDKALDGDLDFEFVSIGSDYYVRLNELRTSDDSLTEAQPIIDSHKDKWLHIVEDFIPEELRNLQEEDEEMAEKRRQLHELFVDTNLFDVIKEYGVESIDGQQVYHYGVSLNRDGFEDYVYKASVIDGREMTNAEVEEAVAVLDNVKDIELWIGTEDYYVYKAVITFSGGAVDEDFDMDVTLTIEGDKYNENLDINAPSGAEEFNPLTLLMLLNGIPAETTEEPLGLGEEDTDLMIEAEEEEAISEELPTE